MFICDSCLKKNFDNEVSFMRSIGTCEVCDVRNNCNDIHHSQLREIDRTLPEKEGPKVGTQEIEIKATEVEEVKEFFKSLRNIIEDPLEYNINKVDKIEKLIEDFGK